MKLHLIYGAVSAIERDFQIPNPLIRIASILDDNVNSKKISYFYPKPQQEEMYYFISGFLKEEFNCRLFSRIRAFFNKNLEDKINGFRKIYDLGLNARNDYDLKK